MRRCRVIQNKIGAIKKKRNKKRRNKTLGSCWAKNILEAVAPFLFVLWSSSFIPFNHYFFHPLATSTHLPITLILLRLFKLSSILLTVLLSFPFNLFCIYPYPSFISIAAHVLSFVRPLHFSTFHFIPIFIPPHACVCLCVWQLGACGYFSGSSPEDWTVIIYGPEL